MTHEERLKLLQTWYEKGLALKKESDDLCAMFGVGDLEQCAILVAAELLRQLRESQARIAVLEEAVTEALAQATGEWDQMQRHPASRFAGDVAYYESVLHPESQAREMLGEDKGEV